MRDPWFGERFSLRRVPTAPLSARTPSTPASPSHSHRHECPSGAALLAAWSYVPRWRQM